MPRVLPDSADFVEIGGWRGNQPIDESLPCVPYCTILSLEFAERGLSTKPDELAERRGVGAKPCAQWFEDRSECRSLSDCVAGV